ncbi:hypothetical protein BGW39_006111 [Mortierella sp. 14UC]|nr:hypothetical protein BGW39_006111 [Mortierella sp. 14UC]
MIPAAAASTLTLLSALTLASTAYANVLSSNPTAVTHWKIGSSTQIRWRLSRPTAKDDIATIYLVGGDPAAYKRLETLATNVRLGDHTLDIPKVSEADCLDTCAIEFVVHNKDGKTVKGDHYSHVFSITTSGEALPASAAVADKSAPVVAGSNQNAATPNGPITLIQNAARGAQPHGTDSSSRASVARLGAQGMAAMVVAAAVSVISMALL